MTSFKAFQWLLGPFLFWPKKCNFGFILATFWLYFNQNSFGLIELQIFIKKSFVIRNLRKFEARNLLHFSLTAFRKKYYSVSLVIKVINRCRTKAEESARISMSIALFFNNQ